MLSPVQTVLVITSAKNYDVKSFQPTPRAITREVYDHRQPRHQTFVYVVVLTSTNGTVLLTQQMSWL